MKNKLFGLTILGLAVTIGFPLEKRFAGPATSAGAQYKRPKDVPYPKSNPYSRAKWALGQTLFFDNLLSDRRNISCASCHNPNLGWSNNLKTSHGSTGSEIALKTPSLLNNAWLDFLGWDGKYAGLEAVTFGPITGAANMNLSATRLIGRLENSGHYRTAFAGAFPDRKINKTNIEMALATFERGIVSGIAPFDRFVQGDAKAISPAAQRGFAIFNGRGHCAQCHSGWAFTDGSFQDIGLPDTHNIGRGRYFQTSLKLKYAFKVPTLRDVATHAPYMHDGSLATLDDVVGFYNSGGIARPSQSVVIKPLGLNEAERHDLVAFLNSLSSVPHDASAKNP
ncbi:MAG: c-type cytochrome [Hyphomicrobiales bacterium]|nr:c-type cytochrome [Hyphomicrobiales bacterium]MDE2116078.1 c-type cytochrome [Hyphomicrobiales bacterium]